MRVAVSVSNHWNYLRVRGEYWDRGIPCYPRVELPPRARRIRRLGSNRVKVLGTTSACAENTLLAGGIKLGNRNYLRVRGEYKNFSWLGR